MRTLLTIGVCVVLSGCGSQLRYATTADALTLADRIADVEVRVEELESHINALMPEQGTDDMEHMWCKLAQHKIGLRASNFINIDAWWCHDVQCYVQSFSDEPSFTTVKDMCEKVAKAKSLDPLFELYHE